MKLTYGLKSTDSTDLVTPLCSYLQQSYDPQTAYSLRGLLTHINELRNKMLQLRLSPSTPDQQLDRMIELVSAYTRFALLILNRFNWNSDRGKVVQGLTLTWHDSFQPKLQFHKNTILIDVFCCYYNLAILNMTRSLKLSGIDNDNARMEAIVSAKNAAYLLREMKEKYYGEFVNSGFHDTQFPHLQILESINLGTIYKCLYNSLKANEFKVGINKVAAICSAAAKHFYNAYSIAESYFMNPSGIGDKTKQQILALTYIESLYFDVMSLARYAKYYATMLDRDPSILGLVIAYQKKAMRLLEIGLKNQSVEQLLNQNTKQKMELVMMQNEIGESLNALIRSSNFMRQREVSEMEIPEPEALPQEYAVKLAVPQMLLTDNPGEFSKLMSEEAYALGQEMADYSDSRNTTVEFTKNRLDDQIQKVYNQSFVNYYLQLEGPQKMIPQALQEKLLQIRKLGGKNKINMNMGTINQSQKNMEKYFKQIKEELMTEEYSDSQKRKQYGKNWSVAPSNEANTQYIEHLADLQEKFKQAVSVDQKIMQKCQRNAAFIETLNSSDQAIMRMLPKPQITKFVQQNQMELAKLRDKSDQLRKHRDYVYGMAGQIQQALSKINYPAVANQMLMQRIPKQIIIKQVFFQTDDLINKFNNECKLIKDEVQAVALISLSLNSKNKDQDKGKRQFEVIINCYNEIAQIYVDCNKAIGFYDKLTEHIEKLTSDVEDFIYARKQAAQQLESSLNKKGGGGFFNNLPEMYPGQKKQPLPHFTPPPVPPSLYGQAQTIWGPDKQAINHFTQQQQNPNQPPPPRFPTNPFQGEVYPTMVITPAQRGVGFNQPPPQQQQQGFRPQAKQPQMQQYPPYQQPPPPPPQTLLQPSSIPAPPLNFNSDPFMGTVFPSTHIIRR